MLFFFRLAIFLGAGLLFLVQPLFAKKVLPLLGGSPTVWNTCMLFFQGLLLLGYAYAHASHRLLTKRSQIGIHALLLVVVLFLPTLTIPADWSPPGSQTPIFWLLGLLFIVVGGPFFALSATSPLLQQWFASTDHPRSGNPYFLYSASNVGSMLALLSYPFLLERIFSLEGQSLTWKYGYAAFVVAMVVCGILTWRNPGGDNVVLPTDDSPVDSEEASEAGKTQGADPLQDVGWGDRLLWIGLSFVPSSWMLGVTTFLTTDISPMPILWIIPLTLYLITFIIAFAERPILSKFWTTRLFPVGMMVIAVSVLFKPGLIVMGLHLFAFFIGAMTCHFRLADRKPNPRHLTEFYFWVSLGGMLGGLVNGLLAPVLFPWVIEYPLTLFLACLLQPTFFSGAAKAGSGETRKTSRSISSKAPNSSNNIETAGSRRKKGSRRNPAAKSAGHKPLEQNKSNDSSESNPRELESKIRLGLFALFALIVALLARTLEFQGTVSLTIAALAAAIGLSLSFFLDRPFWFALVVGGLLFFAQLEPPQAGETVLLTRRGFFGVNRVVYGPKGYQIRLYHGRTAHGIQILDPEHPEWHHQPTSYYHRTGPLGDIFDQGQKRDEFANIGVVGLGAGTTACYWRPGQQFTFYEIDPIVSDIAENPEYFTFLKNCGSENYSIILGDGRLNLGETEPETYDLIILDAFSSDAIPMHLLTLEAIELYKSRLKEKGMLAFHISNQFFDLEPILGDLAAASGMESLTCHDREISAEEFDSGKAAASYVVLAKDVSSTGLNQLPRWTLTRRSASGQPWTDDFSNILDAIRFE